MEKSEPRELLPAGPARAFALGFLVVKLALLASAAIFMDEAYYWLWGQHPGLSYFDHPPLVAWVQGVSGALFGWTTLGVRLPVVLSLVGTLFVLSAIARLLTPERAEAGFWLSALIYLGTPIYFATTGFALPDHLLALFGLASLYGFCRFSGEWRQDAPRGWFWLYFGAFCLGLSVLSKYNGALIGVGFALMILATPAFRPLLKSPHLYLAAGLSLAMQAPVLAWNLQNGWASFGFIVGGRRGLPEFGDLSGLTGYLLTIIVFLSPFLLWPALRFVGARKRPAGEHPGTRLLACVAAVSTLTWLVASLFTDILFHWNLVGYLALVPVLGLWIRRRWVLLAHLAYTGVLAMLAMVNYVLLPILAMVSQADQTSGWSYGWQDVGARVAELQRAHDARFIAATDYALASPLAFALGDRDVTSLSPATEQFDFWFDGAAHAGQDAILIADRWRPLLDETRALFTEIVEIEQVGVSRFGVDVTNYRIYLGRGFRGAPASPALP
ncbi:Dolichyl-phosphate-mannose-protein mannosyltransferase [Devosia enhydra]|uniref:Dolichyl-phosphate-mannose-protein mannosyltransferase n=1 Tax=Devosia enhydra TaxID=665118 RepID=A0A1K2I2G4_9HYPH|nr:glycosyltransferase family 39 protein [Devosia enhydra]SFZ86573.1 Dolichyl-phosphate-mannose-protein mannosyltransferase [Devosia enhydra]